MHRVVDTNVLLVANQRAPQASPQCVLACVELLESLQEQGILVIDETRLILKEYTNNASDTGQPGVGDRFLRWILRNLTNHEYIEQVTITSTAENEFEEFPKLASLEGFDPADRKFVVVSISHPARPAIANAVDSDWRNYEAALIAAGVTIDFLCPELLPKL